jgi:hypothetical protein
MAGGAADAALKWVSFEPWISDMNAPLRKTSPNLRRMLRKNKIAWTMVGGESGLRDDTNLMTLEDARNLLEESKAAGSKVHFKQLGTALAIQRGVYSTRGNGEHRAKGGNPEQWPEDLNTREWPDVSGRIWQSHRSSTQPTTLVSGSTFDLQPDASSQALHVCIQYRQSISPNYIALYVLATRFIRVALAENLCGSALAIFNAAADSAFRSAFVELDRSLAYQFAIEEMELLSSSACSRSIDSNFFEADC